MSYKSLAGSLLILSLLIILLIFTGCNENRVTINFTPMETGTDASIRALHVVDEDIVWASGTNGTFLLSKDGAETWYSDTVPGAKADDLRSIHAWNENEAIVFGTSNPGRGYFTEDGGLTWKFVYENSSRGIFFNSLDFADQNNGMALSDPVDSCLFVISTSDRGKTWNRIFNLPVLEPGEYNFAASNSCIDYHKEGNAWIITGGADARIFITKDHGESWKAFETGIISGNPTSGIFSVAFNNKKDGIIVGGTYDKPQLNDRIAAFSDDGGVSWTLSDTMPGGFRSSVIWLKNNNDLVALALGKTGCDYSLDKGKSWNPGPEINGYYIARAIPGTHAGFAAGSDGKIARFTICQTD